MHFATRLCFTLSPFASVLVLALALDAATVNQTLLRATSPFEDVVEFALVTNTASMSKALAAVDNSAAAVKAVLPAPAAIKFASLVQGIHHSAADNKLHAVAEKAVEVFRLLIDNLQSEGLREPLEVSLLDYAGFKLQVLATSEQPDWTAMRKTVVDAAAWWSVTKAKVSDKGLRDAFNSTVRGLETASNTENLPLLHFAARMDLDLVDLLEAHFRRKR